MPITVLSRRRLRYHLRPPFHVSNIQTHRASFYLSDRLPVPIDELKDLSADVKGVVHPLFECEVLRYPGLQQRHRRDGICPRWGCLYSSVEGEK
ncbi:hypothetical protein L1049_016669 [Liquidambar formosana]|uniref:Uncharacterized protein n=1 Tax=Liquidambar formosana TaxID=63359 RepID=A0AAP0X7N8_LIQFO